MDASEFRREGTKMVEWISEFLSGGVEQHDVVPAVKPGFLRDQLPQEAPLQPESWEAIVGDVRDRILPGVAHWQHSGFHAYFPYGASFPSLMGELLADAIGSNAFSWTSNPSATELELVVMDWLCRALGLPDHFLSTSATGGGVLATSASEAIFTCMVAARARGIASLRKQAEEAGETPEHDAVYLSRLVAYCSEESHSSVQKAAQLCLMKLRALPTDSACAMRGETVRAAMAEDRARGLLPVLVSATLGTTSTAAFDHLESIGPVCVEHGAWFHVDAAYAGSGLICPEFRARARGLELADSMNVNPYKWMLTGADCAALWVRDRVAYCSGLIVEPLYLRAGNTALQTDLRHWGVPLTRKFRALKLWFVLRRYGVAGLQRYQRNHRSLALRFASLVREDARFELSNDVCTGLVCFRLRAPDQLNRRLLEGINKARNIHLTPTLVKGRYIIRFCVNHEHATSRHIDYAWDQITLHARKLECIPTPLHIKTAVVPCPAEGVPTSPAA